MAGALTAAIAAAFSGGGSPPVTTDPYFEYTTLLLPGNGTNGAQNNTFLDGSTNNFTITRNGNTTQGTFSPFSQTGWGNYFSANTSELSFASNAAFNLSGVSWTIEFWAYPTENAPARDRNWITRRQASGAFTSSYQIYCGSGANTLKFLVTGQTVVTSTSSLTPNQWNHVAVVWNGTTLYFYINGVQDATTGTYGAGTGADAEPLRIGRLATNDNVLSYMSNVRVVKGVAVYTGNFTVPSTPLAITQSSGTNISAITGTQTSLLTCQTNRFVDVTANAFVPTVGTGTSVQAFSPFNPTASWSAATYGGSGYFDGSGDYLSAASNTALNLTGDYTVECWFYANSFPTQPALFGIGSDAAGLVLTIVSSKVYVYFVGVGNVFGSGGTTLITNSWNHIAIVRSGTTNTCYINGSQSGTTYSSSSTISSTGGVGIGRTVTGSSFNDWNGYVADFRIVKGTAVYTGAFTPPTAPLTAITNTSLLLNFTNAGIYDATSKNDLETVGNAQISTTQSKFGGSSMYFDGTGDYLMAPQNQQLELGGGDFTIECWTNISAAAANGGIVGKGPVNNVTNTTWSLEFNGSAGTVIFYVFNAGGNLFTSTSNLKNSTWTHIAISRSGNNTRMFINGTQEGATYTSAYTFAQGDNVYIGGGFYAPTTRTITGYIQDVRITKGYGRYTANFTPPTAAFPTL